MENQVIKPVTESEKQSWQSIAFIWVGTMICIPMLLVGALMASGLTLGNVILAAAIGFGICSAIMCFGGIQGTDLGYPAVMCASKAFGEDGSRVVVSLILAVAQCGWFAVQTATCGAAFSQLLLIIFNINFPVWISSCIWGIVMLTTAVYGFKFMKILNYIAVPALVLMCSYGVVVSIRNYTGSIFDFKPDSTIPMLSAISTMIGLFAVGTVINADYTRFAKKRSDTIKASLLGVLPMAVLMITVGAIMSIVAGDYDITKVFASLDLPILSMLVLILATWTTNTGNAYTAGIAVVRLFNIKGNKRAQVTAICGVLGTIIAMLGFANFLSPFLNVLGVGIPPIAGVMIADYWILGRGNKDNWRIIKGFNWAGIISLIIASLIAYFRPVFSPAVDSIVIAIICYIILVKIMKSDQKISQNTEVVPNIEIVTDAFEAEDKGDTKEDTKEM